MSLTITPDMIYALVAKAENTSTPADNIGIVLGADGWTIAVHPEGITEDLCPITAAGVHAWLDGEPLTDDAADAITQAGYEIRGSTDTGAVDVAVVTHYRDADQDTDIPDWETAWAFNIRTATMLIVSDRAEADKDRTWELWHTADGRYVVRVLSSWAGDPAVRWVEVDQTEAARLGYRADDRRVTSVAPVLAPVAFRAARLAAELVDLLTGGDAIPSWGDEARRQATDTVHAAKAVGDLLRQQVLSDIRDRRAAAAVRVVATFDGRQRDTAQHLDIHETTLANLLKG